MEQIGYPPLRKKQVKSVTAAKIPQTTVDEGVYLSALLGAVPHGVTGSW